MNFYRPIIILLLLISCISCNKNKSKDKDVEQKVISLDQSSIDLIENFKVWHILKISELQLTLPIKGESYDSIYRRLSQHPSIKIVNNRDYLSIEEINLKNNQEMLFRMKLYFKNKLYTSGIVNKLDGSW